jgi:hypothetical protein
MALSRVCVYGAMAAVTLSVGGGLWYLFRQNSEQLAEDIEIPSQDPIGFDTDTREVSVQTEHREVEVRSVGTQTRHRFIERALNRFRELKSDPFVRNPRFRKPSYYQELNTDNITVDRETFTHVSRETQVTSEFNFYGFGLPSPPVGLERG